MACHRFQGNRTTHAPSGARGAAHVNNLMFLIFHPLFTKRINIVIARKSDWTTRRSGGVAKEQLFLVDSPLVLEMTISRSVRGRQPS